MGPPMLGASGQDAIIEAVFQITRIHFKILAECSPIMNPLTLIAFKETMIVVLKQRWYMKACQ